MAQMESTRLLQFLEVREVLVRGMEIWDVGVNPTASSSWPLDSWTHKKSGNYEHQCSPWAGRRGHKGHRGAKELCWFYQWRLAGVNSQHLEYVSMNNNCFSTRRQLFFFF